MEESRDILDVIVGQPFPRDNAIFLRWQRMEKEDQENNQSQNREPPPHSKGEEGLLGAWFEHFAP